MKKFILLFLVAFSAQLFGQVNMEWEALPMQDNEKTSIVYQTSQGFLISYIFNNNQMRISKNAGKTWENINLYTKDFFWGVDKMFSDENGDTYYTEEEWVYKLDTINNQFVPFFMTSKYNDIIDIAFKNGKMYVATRDEFNIYNQSNLKSIFSKKWNIYKTKFVLGKSNKNLALTNEDKTYSFYDDGFDFKEDIVKKGLNFNKEAYYLYSGRLISYQGDKFLFSDDDGATWESNSLFPTHSVQYMFVNRNNKVFLFQNNTIQSSVDEGKTWQQLTTPKSDVPFFFMFNNAPNQMALIADDCERTVFVSNNMGQNWQKMIPKYDAPTAQYLAITPSNDVIVGECKVNQVKYANSSAWTDIFINDDVPIHQLFTFPSGKWMAYHAKENDFYYSANKGISWKKYDNFPAKDTTGKQKKIFQNSNGELFASTDTEYYLSTNEGITWSEAMPLEFSFDNTEFRIFYQDSYFFTTSNSFQDDDYIYIYNSVLKKGSTIYKINNTLFNNVSSFVRTKHKKIFFTASFENPDALNRKSKLCYTNDYGETFVTKDLPTYGRLLSDSEGNLIFLTNDEILISYNEGDTWISRKLNLPMLDYSAFAMSNDGYLYFGTYGNSIYKSKKRLVANKDIFFEETDFALSPNPTSDVINIQFSDNQVDMSMALIFSIEGKLLQSMSFYGNNTSLNVQHFPAGMYILQVKNGEKVGVKRFLKHP